MTNEQQVAIQDEIQHRLDGLFERGDNAVRDVYKPLDHNLVQTDLLFQILEMLETIDNRLFRIEDKQ